LVVNGPAALARSRKIVNAAVDAVDHENRPCMAVGVGSKDMSRPLAVGLPDEHPVQRISAGLDCGKDTAAAIGLQADVVVGDAVALSGDSFGLTGRINVVVVMYCKIELIGVLVAPHHTAPVLKGD